MADLFGRYFSEHAEPKKKAATVRQDRGWVTRWVLPALGKTKARDVTRADVANLHHAMRETPYQANRVLEILKKAFNLAEGWGLRPDGSNPCRHVEKFKEAKRERLLTVDELARLGQTLDQIEQEVSEMPAMISLVRLLVLTGCQLGEIQNLKWEHVDLEAGALRLPDSKTGAKVVPLGDSAMELLANLPRAPFAVYVCPGLKANRPLVGIHRAWYRIRERAGLPDLRLHDLRHGWASLAASSGLSLPIIGAVLGHAQPGTTAR
ncbi:MAG: site-specific integrase [Pseudomonadota bacterium]